MLEMMLPTVWPAPWPHTFTASTVTRYITKTSKGIKLFLFVGNQAAYSYHIPRFSLATCQFLDWGGNYLPSLYPWRTCTYRETLKGLTIETMIPEQQKSIFNSCDNRNLTLELWELEINNCDNLNDHTLTRKPSVQIIRGDSLQHTHQNICKA